MIENKKKSQIHKKIQRFWFFMFFVFCVLETIQISGSIAAESSESKPYEISAIEVDKTAVSASVARDLALAQAQRKAFDQLMKRLVIQTDLKKIPSLSDEELSSMIATIQVENEKTSKTRYVARLVYRFYARKVREFLRESNIYFSESISKTNLLVPVYENAGVKILWDNSNDWKKVWEKIVLEPNSVVPLILPEGSLLDIAVIGASQAVSGNEGRLLQLAKRYNLNDVIVVSAVLVQDLNANIPRLHVTVRKISSETNDIIIQSFTGVSREKIEELLLTSASKTKQSIEDDWKIKNKINFDQPDRLSIKIVLPDINYWVSLKNTLGKIPMVDYLEVSYFSREDVQIVLYYFGSQDQLVFALSQNGLKLEKNDEFWSLKIIESQNG